MLLCQVSLGGIQSVLDGIKFTVLFLVLFLSFLLGIYITVCQCSINIYVFTWFGLILNLNDSYIYFCFAIEGGRVNLCGVSSLLPLLWQWLCVLQWDGVRVESVGILAQVAL